MSQKFVSVGALALSLLLGAGALVSQARQNNDVAGAPVAPGPPVVASVDMERLYTASGGPQELARRQAEYDSEALRDLNAIADVPYLKREELSEYIPLLTLEKPSDAQAARLKALHTDSDTRRTELQTLTGKKEADLTPADKARMRELTEQGRLLETIMPSIQEALRANQAQKIEGFRRDQLVALRGDVARVARERGVTQVFDSGTLVYASNDLTPQVLARLTKRGGK